MNWTEKSIVKKHLGLGSTGRRWYLLLAFGGLAFGVPSARAQKRFSDLPSRESIERDLTATRAQAKAYTERIDQLVKSGPPIATDQAAFRRLEADRPNAVSALRDRLSREAQSEEDKARAQYAAEMLQIEKTSKSLESERLKIVQARAVRVPQPESTDRLEEQLKSARAEVSVVNEERRQVIAELRQGAFCSECKRAKSEIEREGKESFQQHLSRVQGSAVMDESHIQEKEQQYTKRIAQASGRVARLSRHIDDAKEAYDEAVADRKRQLDEREETYYSDVEQNRARRTAAESLLSERLAGIASQRNDVKSKVDELDLKLKANIASANKRINEKTVAHKNQLTKLRSDLGGIRILEQTLAGQLSWSDDPILQTVRAEKMADEEIKREDSILEAIAATELALTHGPDDTSSYTSEKIAKAVIQRLGLDSTEEMTRRIEAQYRARLVQKYRRLLDGQPASGK